MSSLQRLEIDYSLCVLILLLADHGLAGRTSEYTAAEAKKHIGETATVVGKVGCVRNGRTYKYLTFDACPPQDHGFWIIVNNDASGPDLDVSELERATIAVSGRIERFQDLAIITVKSTSQNCASTIRRMPSTNWSMATTTPDSTFLSSK